MIKPVVLWTDALVFVLVAVITGFVLYARQREHLRAPWLDVLRSRLAMASLVVLLAYVVSVCWIRCTYARRCRTNRGRSRRSIPAKC